MEAEAFGAVEPPARNQARIMPRSSDAVCSGACLAAGSGFLLLLLSPSFDAGFSRRYFRIA